MVISNQGREDSLGNMRVNWTGLSLHPGHPPTLYCQVLNSHGIVIGLIGWQHFWLLRSGFCIYGHAGFAQMCGSWEPPGTHGKFHATIFVLQRLVPSLTALLVFLHLPQVPESQQNWALSWLYHHPVVSVCWDDWSHLHTCTIMCGSGPTLWEGLWFQKSVSGWNRGHVWLENDV